MSDSVGSVAVDVLPDARLFAEKLRAQLRDLVVKIKPEVDDKSLAEQIAKMKAEVEAGGPTAPTIPAPKTAPGSKEKAKQQGAEIGGKYGEGFQKSVRAALKNLPTPQIGAATSEADQKLRDLYAELAALGDKQIGIDISDTEAQAKVDELRARLAELGASSSSVEVRVNSAAAIAELAKFSAIADVETRDRTTEIKVKTDRSATSFLSGVTGSLGLIPALALAAGSALVPLIAVLGGVVGALAAPLAIAAGGATLFAFLAGFAVKDTQKQLKAIDALDKKLGGLKKGTQAYTDTLAQLKNAQAALSPAQKHFTDALGSLKATFSNTFLRGKGSQDLLGPITSGLKLLTAVMPSLLPIIHAVGGAFTTLLDELGKGAKSAGFKGFITAVSKQLGPDLVAFGHIAGNVIKGVSGLFLGFGKHLSGPILRSLEDFSRKFANIGSSKGLQSFFAYVKKVGPQVGRVVVDIAKAIGHIITAAAPLGPVVLAVFDGLAKAISSIPIPVLTGLVVAIGAIALVSGIGPIAAAVVAIGAAAVYAYKHFAPFRKIVDQVVHIVGGAARRAFKQLGDTFRHDILPTFHKVKPQLEEIARFVGKVVLAYAKFAGFIIGRVLPVLIVVVGFLFKHVVPALVAVAVNFIHNVSAAARFAGAVGRAIGAVIGFIGRVIGAAVRLGNGFADGVSAVVRAVGRMAGAVADKVGSAIGVVRSIPGRILRALGNLGGLLVHAGGALIDGLIGGISSKIGALIGKMAQVAKAIRDHLPGSPVRRGPLVSWNNGGAGKRLVQMLADGLDHTGPLDAAMGNVAGRINAGLTGGLSPYGLTGALAGGVPAATASAHSGGGIGGGGAHAITITNWDEGTGYIEAISETVFHGENLLATGSHASFRRLSH